MDLMIDCMSYCNASFVDDDKLYEMLEDDMRTIANLSNNNNNSSTTTSNSSSSPSCLSDEEQLAALSNDTTNLIDEFLLFNNSSSSGGNSSTSSHISPNSNTNQQQQQLPINANSSNSSSAANSSSNNGILSHHTPTTGLSSNSNSPSSTTSSSSSNSSSSSYYQSPPVLSYHHQHSGDIFNYSTSSSSSSSPSSSSTSSPSISAVPSPLSLSSSSSSLCAALANASFSSGSSSSSSSACSSNLASPVCLSPGQQAAHFHSSSQQLSLPPQHPHAQYHHAAQISPSSHLHHPQQQQQHIIHHPYQNYQQVQQQQPQQEQFMLSESTINYHLNKQKQHLMLEDDFGTTNVVGGGNNVSQYMVQAQETSYNPSATNTAASTRPSPSPNTMTGNAAYSLFQTINPMDINRNYAATTSESQQFNTTTKASRPMCLPTSGNSNNKTAYLNTTSGQQTIKRGKFSHNQQSGVFRIKQESSSSIQSDGESSSVSNESDSNSSTFSNDHNIQHFTSQSKKLIITATKLETQSFYSSSSASSSPSSTSSSSQQQPQFTPTQTSLPSINVIKIAAANQKEHADNLLLPITPAKISIVEPTSASNTKTIIQYKQIVNPSVNTTTAKQSIKHSKQNGNTTTTAATTATTTPSSNNTAVTAAVSPVQVTLRSDGKAYPKPPYSYSCLIAMALRNSDSGTLPVSDIYEFIVENFPYYKTARDGWKNSIRHNLSLNKCFEKIENPTNGSKKGCLWALNPDKCKKLEEECKRCRQRDPVNIRLSMSRPDDLNKIERGEQRIKKYTAQRKQQQQQMSLDSANTSNTQSDAASNGSSSPSTFLLEWSSKSNPANQSQSLVKDEPSDQFENFDDLGNSDIKFDPILLSTVNSTI